MLSDPIADLLTRIRNASQVKKKQVSAPYSKLKENLVKILVEKGYVKSFKVEGKIPEKNLILDLKYPQNRASITNVIRISKPGVRIYANTSELTKYLRGRGITILSTSKGLMTAKQAKDKHLGGEVVCKVN